MTNPFNPLFDLPVTGAFTASLAHELYNPLATIDLPLELILNECEFEKRIKTSFTDRAKSCSGIPVHIVHRITI
jgi:hypothetical protein